MNDEIKEILDDLLFTTTLPNVSIKLNEEKINQLKDYITNLQQELEEEKRIEEADLKTIQRLEEENERLKEWKEDLLKENIELENIRKEAIEYIEEAIENGEYFEDDIATDISEPSYDKYVNSNDLLNILQNGSVDNE